MKSGTLGSVLALWWLTTLCMGLSCFLIAVLVSCAGSSASKRIQMAEKAAAYGTELNICYEEAKVQGKNYATYENCAQLVDQKYGRVR